MSNIKVTIAGRDIKVADGYEKPSAGDVNTCLVSFTIEGGVLLELPNKRVTFYSRAGSVTLDYADELQIPWEVLVNAGALYLTLTGYDPNGNEVARTHHMIYPIEIAKSGLDEGTEPTQPTLDVVSRIDNLASTLEQSETTRQEAFESAQNERSSAFQASMSEWQQDVAESVSQASIATEKANSATSDANNAATNANEAADNANNATANANKAAEDIRAAAERGDFDGAHGEPGADGYSPTANVTKDGGTATITVTDKNGTTTATVSDGAPGKDGSDATATDVRIAGESITADGVADIPPGTNSSIGLVRGYPTGGIYVNDNGIITTFNASDSDISARTNVYKPIVSSNLDFAVKAAMCDGKGASWTNAEKLAARKRMNAADANKVYIMQKQIENIQGIAATEETDTTEAYTKTIPTGAQKWASLDKVGGKTIVNAGELVSAEVVEVECSGKNLWPWGDITVESGVEYDVNITSTVVISAKDEAVYSDVAWNVRFTRKDGSFGHVGGGGYFYSFPQVIEASESNPITKIYLRKGLITGGRITNIQLEYGREPTSYEPYREPWIAYSVPQYVIDRCPLYGASAGTVCNEIDFERKVYVQRVGSVDLGTLNWDKFEISTGTLFRSSEVTNATISTSATIDSVLTFLCAKYETKKNVDRVNMSISRAATARRTFDVIDSSYSSSTEFKSAVSGVLLYYELAEPIEVDLSDVLNDDNFIEVEAGGTVTFKQASTQLPVPSSVTYQISTKEVVANA